MLPPNNAILWRKNNPGGFLRRPFYPGDAGYDMASCEDTLLVPGEINKVDCGIHVALPAGVSAMVIGRSSLILHQLVCVSTLIDSGYRGPMYVFIYCVNKVGFRINTGDRIAQLVPLQSYDLDVLELSNFDLLAPTAREESGFGSTGNAVRTGSGG